MIGELQELNLYLDRRLSSRQLPPNDRTEQLAAHNHVVAQDSGRGTARRLVWFALVLAGAAGIARGLLFYWLVGDWMQLR
jgi:hypothetical protein